MSNPTMNRDSYLNKNVGDFPAQISIGDLEFEKVEDLRYGTNPHQASALFKIKNRPNPIGDLVTLKNGKNGLSQTNLEDISYALNIVKFFGNRPACAIMKHVNPCGFAIGQDKEPLSAVYARAYQADSRAAFGGTIASNVTVDAETARQIMSTFNECVVAPDFTPEAIEVFNDAQTYKLNRHLRVLKCGDLSLLPRFVGDDTSFANTIKVLADGSLIIAAPLLTSCRTVTDLKQATGENKAQGIQHSNIQASTQQLDDLLAAWYVNLNVRSNGVVIMKNGETLAVGTGEQDRVGAVEQAIAKFKQKYTGKETLQGAVMSSDGFFPFPDAVEIAAAAGITAIVSPPGSLKDADVIVRANELGVALYHAPERIFSHH